ADARYAAKRSLRRRIDSPPAPFIGGMHEREPLLPAEDRRFVRRLLISAGLLVLGLFLWRILDVLLLVFGAILVAVLLRAIADPIAARARISPILALSATVVLLLSLFVLAG